MGHLIKTDPLRQMAINVNFTVSSHNWSRLHLRHDRIESKCVSPTQLRPLFYLECARTCSLELERRWDVQDVQDVGVGDISSWRSLAHQQHSLSLCKKSVQVCFHRNNIALYKISRHFFCFMFKRSQVAYHPLHTLDPPAPHFLH